MRDTSPEMDQKMREMISKKTPAERVKMGCSMHDMSKILVGLGIRSRNPNISPVEFRKELFLSFYGNDFDAVQKEKILKHLESFE